MAKSSGKQMMEKPQKKHLLPDFLIIGAGKSGTTSLYQYLKAHPQIFMPAVKEPNFFALEGMAFPDDDPLQQYHFPEAVTRWDDYIALFKDAKEGQISGECSPLYLYAPIAPENIKKHLPEVKLIAILRDPVERLYSRYLHLKMENRAPAGGMLQALDRNSIWWQRNDLVPEGFYLTHIKRYLNYFDKSQLLILFYEDLVKNPAALFQRLLQFIGADQAYTPVNLSIQYNPSGIIEKPWLFHLTSKKGFLRKSLEKACPQLIDWMKRNHTLQKSVIRLRKLSMRKPPLSPHIRKQLIEKIYKDEITGLQQLTGRDLSHWLT